MDTTDSVTFSDTFSAGQAHYHVMGFDDGEVILSRATPGSTTSWKMQPMEVSALRLMLLAVPLGDAHA